MNCAFRAFMEASRVTGAIVGRNVEARMEDYYSVLRHATGGDTGIYVGCAHWALHSTVGYAYRCGWLEGRPRFSMWYADWVSMDELVRLADGSLARNITRTWFRLSGFSGSSPVDHSKYIVFDLATCHASYGHVRDAQFPMAAIWVAPFGRPEDRWLE